MIAAPSIRFLSYVLKRPFSACQIFQKSPLKEQLNIYCWSLSLYFHLMSVWSSQAEPVIMMYCTVCYSNCSVIFVEPDRELNHLMTLTDSTRRYWDGWFIVIVRCLLARMLYVFVSDLIYSSLTCYVMHIQVKCIVKIITNWFIMIDVCLSQAELHLLERFFLSIHLNDISNQ